MIVDDKSRTVPWPDPILGNPMHDQLVHEELMKIKDLLERIAEALWDIRNKL